MTPKKITRQDLRDAAEKYKNWGKWGPNDEIGTLNYTHPEDIIAAPFDMRDGCVRPPEGPGLGVELDERRVEHFRAS